MKAPATLTDNSAMAMTVTEMEQNYITSVEIDVDDWVIMNTAADEDGVKVWKKGNVDWPEQWPQLTDAWTGQVWAVLEIENDYIPVSAERLTLKATFTRD
jgi:hypothetical protein